MPTKFQLTMPWPKEPRGERETRPMTINLRDPVKSGKYDLEWQTAFTLKIPDVIWETLKGKKLPKRTTSEHEADYRKYYDDTQQFPKTLSEPSLYQLCISWKRLVEDYEWAVLIDKHPMERVIFYDLGGDSDGFTYGSWSRSTHGTASKARFVYVHGYRLCLPELASEYRKYGDEFRYTEDRDLIPSYQHEDFYKLKCVRWTEERQMFFDQLQLSFDGLIERVNNFESQISEEKIDALAESRLKLLEA